MSVNTKLGDTQLILTQCQRQGLLRNQAAYVLATAWWETAHTMRPVREAFWLSEDWRKANLRYYPWYGRGYVQLTWHSNYAKAERILNTDLTSDPDAVMQPDVAAQILVRGCKEGWFTDHKLGDFLTARKSDYVGARRVINGTDKAHAIAELARDYEDALKLDPAWSGERAAPVVNQRRDGSAPRTGLHQSTTMQAVATAGLATVSQSLDGVKAIVARVSEMLGVSPEVALAIVAGGALAWIFRERWLRWIEGDR